MKRTGVANLPLHPGKAPRWLFKRMVNLSEAIVGVIIQEYNREEFLKRISDPFWFQAFSCVLGFDWHSSGTTTVTCGALKTALSRQNYGIKVAGGKGKVSRNTPLEIDDIGTRLNITTEKIEKLKYSSKMTAKVDSAAIQDQHQLYHHVFIVIEEGKWAVIQQGLNEESNYARRYHWLSEDMKSFIDEPHNSILGTSIPKVLDMTSKQSNESREISVDLVKDNPKKLTNILKSAIPPLQTSLDEFRDKKDENTIKLETLSLPKRVNWRALKNAYEFQPKNYEEMLSLKGIGPGTIRALALISELVYGSKPSWKDPVRYSFAVGGKDGVPFPVDRRAMFVSTNVLKTGIEEAKLGKNEKLDAVKRLRRFVYLNNQGII